MTIQALTTDPDHFNNIQSALNSSYRSALTKGIESKADQTQLAYKGKRQEFATWCATKQFPDGILVNEKKVVLFLQTEVIGRAVRHRRKRGFDEISGETKVLDDSTVGFPTIKQYVNALTDLHSTQVANGLINVLPALRGKALRGLLKSVPEQNETTRKKEQYEDRGKGTILEMYIIDDVYNLMRTTWTAACTASGQDAILDWLRTSADFFFGHSLLLRSANCVTADLADMSVQPLGEEGPTECPVVVLTMDESKTNKAGSIQYAGFVRHKDYRICPVSQLAMYMYYQWEITKEKPPTFTDRRSWYDTPLFHGSKQGWRSTKKKRKTQKPQSDPLPGLADLSDDEILTPAQAAELTAAVVADSEASVNTDPTKPPRMSYHTNLRWTNKLFQSSGLISRKKTHAGRAAGAQYAEFMGVPEASIRRAGHWAHNVLSTHYLANIQRDFIRKMSGFRITPGSYHLPRASVEPSEHLNRKIFPWADEWLRWYGTYFKEEAYKGLEDIPFKYINPPPEHELTKEQRCDLSAQGFLRLVKVLRKTFLQDSVLLRKDYPSHPCFRDNTLFKSKEYLEFAAASEAAMESSVAPQEMAVKDVLPELMEIIDLRHTSTVGELRSGNTITHTAIRRLLERIDSIDYRMQRPVITTTYPPIQSNITRNASRANEYWPPAAASHVAPPAVSAPSQVRERPETDPTSFQSDIIIDSTRQSASFGLGLPTLPEIAEQQRLATSRKEWQLPFNPKDPPVVYKLDRSIDTVDEVFREWTVGYNRGPPVMALERAWGTGWRAEDSERVMFWRRKLVIEAIRRVANMADDEAIFEAVCKERDQAGNVANVALREAIEKLQERRVVRKSLNGLYKALAYDAKTRAT